MKLSGKVAIVSGASKGIGRALAKRYAREGATVCLCARHVEELRAASLEIMAAGGKSIFEQTDVSDESQVEEFIRSCASSFQTIDILVNNAGIVGPRVPIAGYNSQEWDRVMAVNLNGAFYLVKHALPFFNTSGGSIINLSSSVGKTPKPDWGAYGISKFAIEGLTQVLAEELRPRNIRVNAVNPGAVVTAMRHQAFPDEDQRGLKKPEDVLDVFVYLASDESKGVTGQTFDAQRFSKKR
ncbi:MAG TPA: SDR family NAD(P)-dependent oxidoreductase [Bacteroidota bacterium]|nr:SDR family NAD(P)-dependent oxidoreductase [Bacteroidota bacterium]